jgi:hypothetical protein
MPRDGSRMYPTCCIVHGLTMNLFQISCIMVFHFLDCAKSRSRRCGSSATAFSAFKRTCSRSGGGVGLCNSARISIPALQLPMACAALKQPVLNLSLFVTLSSSALEILNSCPRARGESRRVCFQVLTDYCLLLPAYRGPFGQGPSVTPKAAFAGVSHDCEQLLSRCCCGFARSRRCGVWKQGTAFTKIQLCRSDGSIVDNAVWR